MGFFAPTNSFAQTLQQAIASIGKSSLSRNIPIAIENSEQHRLTKGGHKVDSIPMKTATDDIPVTFAGLDRRGTVPHWARQFRTSRSSLSELCNGPALPGITVVQSSGPRKIIDHTDELSILFKNHLVASNLPSRLVLGFNRADADEYLNLATFLADFPGLTDRVELARRSEDLYGTLLEAILKIVASKKEDDVLGEVESVAKVDRALRADNGRLDARKVAKTFGISVSELGRQIGIKNRQTISKTPDAEALQPLLRPYEKIARLRTVLSDADFKAWLNTPNELLEDEDAPIAYLKAGAQQPLAAFAQNMLTGSST